MFPQFATSPGAEHEATREGEHKEEDREDQFKFLVFIFVGKSKMMKLC